MAIRVALSHRTTYRFDRHVASAPHEIRLRPAPHCRTPILSYSLNVAPEPHFLNWQQDPYGNWVARLVFPERADAIEIEVDLVADLTVINPFDFFVEPYAETFPFTYAPALAKELIPFLETAPLGPRLTRGSTTSARRSLTDESPVLLLVRLNQLLQSQIKYLVRMQPGVQTPEETLGNAAGSCRDTGWLLVQIMRHLGLAARFASGYLDAAGGRHQGARRPVGHRPWISPTCMRGRRCSFPARAGSASIRRRDCSPARATFRWRAPRIPATRRR